MKVFKNLLILLLLVSTAMVSCKKSEPLEDEDPPVQNVNQNNLVFTAKIDDVKFTANTAVVAIENGKINITGTNKDGESIVLELDRDIKAQYALNVASPSTAIYKKVNLINGTTLSKYSTKEGSNTSGLAEITEIDTVAKTISGKFNFEAGTTADQTKKKVTEGIFTKVKYTGNVEKPIAPRLSAKINDVVWTGTTVKIAVLANILSISAKKTDNTEISIFVPVDVTPDTYGFTPQSNYMAHYKPNATVAFDAQEGTLVITEHNTIKRIIKGNFEFKATDPSDSTNTKIVTEGTFHGSY